MINAKVLNDSAWKDLSSKNKIKDNGLLKTLSEIKRLREDDHDGASKLYEEALKLGTQLKKSKEASGNPAVSKFLSEMTSAAEAAQKDVAKAKAEAEKKGKLEAEAKKGEEVKGGGEDEEVSDLLTTKMVPLLRDIAKGGHTMHVLAATAGKEVVVLISRKPIAPMRRKMLADELGVSGGIKYIVGHCLKEENATTFVMKTQVAGMAKKIKAALLTQTQMRLKVRCRGEDGETDEDLEESLEKGAPPGEGNASGAPLVAANRLFDISAAVGDGCKNLEADVRAVQVALNRRADAGVPVDGRCGPSTLAAIAAFQQALGDSNPDGRIEPKRGVARALAASGKVGKAPPPANPIAPPQDLGKATVDRAPEVWHAARGIVDHNVGELKRLVLQHYSNEHPEVLAEIDRNVQRVDVVLD
nr:peptidoglycan-binding protein [Pseudomonadota bacterium]